MEENRKILEFLKMLVASDPILRESLNKQVKTIVRVTIELSDGVISYMRTFMGADEVLNLILKSGPMARQIRESILEQIAESKDVDSLIKAEFILRKTLSRSDDEIREAFMQKMLERKYLAG